MAGHGATPDPPRPTGPRAPGGRNRLTHDVCAEVGDRWERFLAPVVAAQQERDASLRVQLGRHSTKVLPLRAWASFSRHSPPGGEDLVISLDVRREPDGFHAQADIALGDGTVLAESAVETVAFADDVGVLRAQASRAMQRIEAFLTAHSHLLSAQLADVPP